MVGKRGKQNRVTRSKIYFDFLVHHLKININWFLQFDQKHSCHHGNTNFVLYEVDVELGVVGEVGEVGVLLTSPPPKELPNGYELKRMFLKIVQISGISL